MGRPRLSKRRRTAFRTAHEPDRSEESSPVRRRRRGTQRQLAKGLPDIELQYTELIAFSALKAVLDAGVSVALGFPPIVALLVSSRTIGSGPLMAVLHEDSPLARQPVVSLRSLGGLARAVQLATRPAAARRACRY
ncbi:hypothetical protein [Variovorax sp. Varisp62]|uniref:hypothetical protein n=1 Tax=Variovorax sp. Varisp62 TaxID=3243049 RepID=UPI0039B64372